MKWLLAIAVSAVVTAGTANPLCVGQDICCEDALSYCRDKINMLNPNKQLIGNCLFEHKSQLTAACRVHLLKEGAKGGKSTGKLENNKRGTH